MAPRARATQVNFDLSQNSLFLGVNILSRYFRLAEVDRGDLQLAGAAALLIASKHEEVSAVWTARLVCRSEYPGHGALTAGY